MGAQGFLSDVINGFFILFERQLDVGDEVVLTNGPITVSGQGCQCRHSNNATQRRRPGSALRSQSEYHRRQQFLGQTRPEILADLWYNRKSLIKERRWFLEKQLGNGCTWINLDVDKIKKLEDLSEIYGFGQRETIEYALDRNERAHMDYNRENGTVTFIYNVLELEKDKGIL